MKMEIDTTVAPSRSGPAGGIRLRAQPITGDLSVAESFDRQMTVADLTAHLSRRMALPASSEYALRSERTGAYLDARQRLDEACRDDEELVVTPQAHLGGHNR